MCCTGGKLCCEVSDGFMGGDGGGGHGGRRTSWTWPGCFPRIAKRVELGAVARATRPRLLTQVSHSRYLSIKPSTNRNTTTLRFNATHSQSLRTASPSTCSRNSSSPTSRPMASSHKMTLFKGYRGLLPPPTKNMRDDVCMGCTMESVPFCNSRLLSRVNGRALYIANPEVVHVVNI